MASVRDPASEGAFFFDDPVEVEIHGDIVHMRFVSAGRIKDTRCSIHNMLVGIERCKRAYADWERDTGSRVRKMRDDRGAH